MKKNKKLLMYFLLLNIVASSYLNAAPMTSLNSDKMYNNVIKNIEKGKNNDGNYKTIEKILNQKNKELKDLYLQNDYVVKPEYLEWQVFFTGFYDEYGKGVDNSKENAKLHSKATGYYDEHGKYVSTSGMIGGLEGKPFQRSQQPKEINLGVSIPIKGMTREPLNLSLTPAGEITINPGILNVTPPSGVTVPQIDIISFQPLAPDLKAPIPIIVEPFNLSFGGSPNGDSTWFNQTGQVAPIKQQSMEGSNNGRGTFETLFTGGNGVKQYINNTDMQGYAGGHMLESGLPHTENNYRFGGTASFGSMLLVGGEYIPINNMELIGLRTSTAGNLALFHTDSHNDHGSSKWDLNNTNVTLKGEKTIFFDVQYHFGYGRGGDSGMVFNNGTIIADNSISYTAIHDNTLYSYSPKRRYIFVTIADTGDTARYLYFKNESNGKIYLNGTQDTLSNFAAEDNTNYGGSYFENRGRIELNGIKSMGAVFVREYNRSWVRFENALNLNGDRSVGVVFTDNFNTNAKDGAGTRAPFGPTFEQTPVKDSVFNIKIGEKSNPSDADSNDTSIVGNTATLVEEATALYFKNESGTRKDYKIMHTQLDALEFAKRATLVSVAKGKVILDGTDTTNRLKIDGGSSKTGIDNIAIYAGAIGVLPGTTVSEVESYIPLTITNSDLSTAIFGEKRGKIINDGNITISGSDGVKGIITNSYAVATFNGNMTLTNGGVYIDSSNKKTGSVVLGALDHSLITGTGLLTADVKGKESIALYADNNSTIDIQNTASNIKALDGAFALTATNTGMIKYGGNNIEAGQRSLLFYLDNTSNIEIVNASTNAKIGGATNATDRGTAFYYKSPTAYGSFNNTDISTYFTNRYNSTLSNLTLNMEEGARLFIVDNVVMNLSNTNISMSGVTNAPAINKLGSSFKTFMLYQSDLTIDQTVNLDVPTDDYNNLEIVTSKITNNGFGITGNSIGQAAMAQENGFDMNGQKLARDTVTLKNNSGIISLSGDSSVGMYANRGEIYNDGTGKINISGDGSIGIYAANEAKVETATGTEINIGKNGVGIYAEGWKQGITPPTGFGTGELDIKNSGLIKSGTGTNAIGIYLNNNSGVLVNLSKLDLSSGKIDVSASEGGIGVYVNGGIVTDSGSEITVGKNGIGIYANNANVTFNNATINLNGDNALGLYLDGNTIFNTLGTNNIININGQNVVLFNMVSSGAVSNNFTVGTVAPGSSYSLGNIVNGSLNYTGSSVLSSNGVLVSGQNSAVFLNGSTITVNPGSTGVAAIALDGQGTPLSVMSPNTDGENTGIITLENASVGLYGKNGTRLKNNTSGVIIVGDQSAGIMTSGVGSTVVNSGTINIGTRSQGMTLKDGISIINNTGAKILSSGIGSVGMYADNVTGLIVNNGTIQLLGNKSIGIYTKGTSIKTINNNGTIEVGNSNSTTDPSIGIFSENIGDVITNTNKIKSGANSIGIYSSGGTVNQNGILDIGDTGVGVYSVNGIVNIGGTSTFNFGTNNTVGVYGINSGITNNASMNIGNGNYGFILTNGTFTSGVGNIAMGNDSVYVYRSGIGAITNSSTVTMNGSNNIGFYIVAGGEITNNANITGTVGNNNVGIYNVGGRIDNTGTIAIGASDLIILKDPADGRESIDVQNSKYAVGIYGENSVITNQASGNISIGYGSIGVVAKKGSTVNDGTITGTGDRMMGMYSEGATIINNNNITLIGNNVIGMAGNGKGSKLINTGIITVSGENAIGMYGNFAAEIINSGTIIANGLGAQGIVLSQGSKLENTVTGTMIINSVTSGNYGSSVGTVYPTPSIINSGVIKVSEKFETDGINVVIKVDPSTVTVPTASEISSGGYDSIASGADYLISNATSIEAPSFNITNPLQITGNFAEGTNVKKYKLEDVIIRGSGNGIDAGTVPVVSKSLTWRATPVVNGSRTGVDIWMEKIDYDEFTDGLWYEDFGRALDEKYFNAQGDALKIYDKIDVIEKEPEFRHVMASLAGNVYANINQRENDISRTFENSLNFIENSENNTKENVKINVIAGKGKNKEETDGVLGYDYITTGVLALREVEQTYKHKFGYSLGYLHTEFKFKDGNESKEKTDTVQLGVYNKYNTNNWVLKNDLTGRVSFHDVERNIDWPSPLERSEMNGTYETYSITSDNKLGREFGLGKKSSVTPYAGLRAMYVTRPTFKESGLEALEVEGNDAWSVKPRAGVELQTALPLGNTAWQVKGTLDLAYEYELADLNEREKAKLVAIEDGYHKLSKPKDEKGAFRTKASVGVEVKEKYGIFITGEYLTGEDKEDDYRAGVILKAVF